MPKSKRGWHNPPKFTKASTQGHCPYCHKPVKSLEAHIKATHRGAKPKR